MCVCVVFLQLAIIYVSCKCIRLSSIGSFFRDLFQQPNHTRWVCLQPTVQNTGRPIVLKHRILTVECIESKVSRFSCDGLFDVDRALWHNKVRRHLNAKCISILFVGMVQSTRVDARVAKNNTVSSGLFMSLESHRIFQFMSDTRYSSTDILEYGIVVVSLL